MKKIIIFTLLLLSLLLSACSIQKVSLVDTGKPVSTLSLNGQWQFLVDNNASQKSQWKKINVPANWYKQGFDISGKAQYKKQFFVSRKLQGKRVSLVFKGVDYIAEVLLNGKRLGVHEGYFQTFSFDATPYIQWGKNNELQIFVDSPLETEEDYSLHKRLIKGIFSHHDTRPGGAWTKRGQEKNTGGIWNSVELHISEKIFAKQLKTIPKQLNKNTWQLNTSLVLQGELPEGAELHWQLKAKNHKAPTLSGVSQSKDFSITANNPSLWWPIGFGRPNLYQLTVEIKLQGKLLDRISTNTAFRRVQLTKNKIWMINSQPMLLRGTNYIASQWLSEMSSKKFARDIQLMKAANINAIRVHAHVTASEFYNLCDENGLMVWQDFPLQWGYQDTAEFHRQAQTQLADMLTQFGNHPSIIHWTLHNEPPWDASWMKWKYSDYDSKQNKELDGKLYVLAKQLDQSRPISKYSSTKEHPWLGWYSGHWLDYSKPTKQAFIAEFGAQALPNKSILKRILQGDIERPEVSKAEKKREWKSWKKWKYHNFQPKETFEIAKVDAGKNTSDLIKNTQAYQAQLIQLAAESYRRQAYKPVTAMFQFMFVEDWESMNWGIIDYWRNTKLGYQSLQMAYQPILPSLEWSKVEYPEGKVAIGLWVLNDTPKQYQDAYYEIKLSKNGRQIDRKRYSVNFKADSHRKIKSYQTPMLQAGKYQLKAKLIDNKGHLLGENQYHFLVVSKNNKQ